VLTPAWAGPDAAGLVLGAEVQAVVAVSTSRLMARCAGPTVRDTRSMVASGAHGPRHGSCRQGCVQRPATRCVAPDYRQQGLLQHGRRAGHWMPGEKSQLSYSVRIRSRADPPVRVHVGQGTPFENGGPTRHVRITVAGKLAAFSTTTRPLPRTAPG